MELAKPVRDRMMVLAGSKAEQDATNGSRVIGVSWSDVSSHGPQG